MSAGETPLCSVDEEGECRIGAPDSAEYCAGQANTTDCARFQDFEALYMRGEKQLAQRTQEATAATNSVVFNAFIWLQVGVLLCCTAKDCSCTAVCIQPHAACRRFDVLHLFAVTEQYHT